MRAGARSIGMDAGPLRQVARIVGLSLERGGFAQCEIPGAYPCAMTSRPLPDDHAPRGPMVVAITARALFDL
jgi:hypothetical protein